MADRAVIDLEHLARYTGGDRALNSEIMRLFDQQTSQMVANLRGILEARDARSWKDIAHTLKGAAKGIGAFPMADAAALCEPISPEDGQLAERALSALERQSQAVQAFIKAYLGR